jgi:hypothetical protein
MSQKRWWIALLGGGTTAAGGLGALIYFAYGDIAQARENVASLRTSIETSRKLLTGTGQLEREVIVLRETEEVIQEILPDEQDINNFVRDLSDFKEDTGVQITALKKKTENAAARNKEKTDFDKVGYQLQFQADAFQLLAFLDKIESHSRFMRVPEFKLSAAARRQVEDEGKPEHKVQMDIETYVYRPQDGPKTVKIDGYARKRELLLGEINRRRQALTVPSYSYRGQRGRRDPWVDPRVPAQAQEASGITVEQQIQIVQGLIDRTQAVVALWEEVQHPDSIITEMTQRAELEQLLAKLEEDVRRELESGAIRFVPAERQLQVNVVAPITSVRNALSNIEQGKGPTKEMLTELISTMNHHFEAGEYELAIGAFDAVAGRLDLAEKDPLRRPLAVELRRLNVRAHDMLDFSKISIDIKAVAIGEGSAPVALINGHTLGEGDLVDSELVIRSIRPGAIEFVFRGMILERRF